jgi:hypothetical protein
MPIPLAAIAIGAGISAIMEAINQYEESGDPQALMAAKQMREQSILDNMRAGMPRAGAEAAVDANITSAIERESKEFSMGDVVGAGVVGGVLAPVGGAAAGWALKKAGSKFAKPGLEKMGEWTSKNMGFGGGAPAAKAAAPVAKAEAPAAGMSLEQRLAKLDAEAQGGQVIPEPSTFARAPANPIRSAEDYFTGYKSDLGVRQDVPMTGWSSPIPKSVKAEVLPRATGDAMTSPMSIAGPGRTYNVMPERQQLGYDQRIFVDPSGNASRRFVQPSSRDVFVPEGRRYAPRVGDAPFPIGSSLNPDFMRKTGMWVDEVGDTGIAPRMVDDFVPASGGGTMLYGPGQWAAPGSPQQMAFQRMLDQAMMRRRMYGTEGG